MLVVMAFHFEERISQNIGDEIAPNALLGLSRMEATKLAEASDDDIAVMMVGWTNVGG